MWYFFFSLWNMQIKYYTDINRLKLILMHSEL